MAGRASHEYDVVFWDNVSAPVDDTIVASQAIGGSELVVWLLARAMAMSGLRVAVWQKQGNRPVASRQSGVTYLPSSNPNSTLRCRLLVHHRSSSNEHLRHVTADRFVALISDLWGPHYEDGLVGSMGKFGAKIVCVSEFQRAQVPSRYDTIVIPNPLPDVSEAAGTWQPRAHRYVYASARMKGLDATLDMWLSLKSTGRYPEAVLEILSPGYDSVGEVVGPDVQIVGAVPTSEVIARIRSSDALFYVNTLPETFCLVAAVAEAVGTRVHVLEVNGGAVGEVVNSPLVTSDADKFKGDFDTFYGAPRGRGTAEPRSFDMPSILEKWVDLIHRRD